jgi:hydroxyacyl-ACP dehydratase HTD2-like protein with hotdog domain
MFRAAYSSRKISLAPLPKLHHTVFRRSLSEDTKQEIVKRLLSAKRVTHVDELTYKKRQQWEAAIGGFIPLQSSADFNGSDRTTYLPPGQHLLYCNTTVPTEQLLPDGTDTAFSPPAPWSSRLWAGGHILFPQPHKLGILESPKVILIEYVRDVRITGPDGQEKIFVKIERRVGRLNAGRSAKVGHGFARTLWRRTSDDIGNSLVVETRDLCFLREKGSTVPFERRHITPPKNPDYSHSLTPTPALLFRFSALTYNAHAIHIDPDYTRNVYGFPNLLVHGPLALALMLEYVRQLLFKISGVMHDAPIVTEVDYRNLAPLFANKEMTICVKKKGSVRLAQSLSTTPAMAKPGQETTDGIPLPSASENESFPSTEDEGHEPANTSPPRAITTESGVDIGKGFSTSPSDEEHPILNEHEDYTTPKFKPSTPTPLEAGKPSEKEQYPQVWEVWIQTGQGDKASLAVRGTVKIEMVKKPKQSPPTVSRADDTTSTRPGLTEEESGMLQKVKSMLERKQGDDAPKSQPRLRRKNNTSPSRVGAETAVDTQATPTITKYTTKNRKLIRKLEHHLSHRDFSTHRKPVMIRPIRTDDTSVRFAPRLKIRIPKWNVAPFRLVSQLAIRPHNPKVAYNVARGVNTYDVRFVESSDGVRCVKGENGLREMLERRADEDDIAVHGIPSNNHRDAFVDGSKTVPPAMGAFERTLRVMLEES